MAASFQGMKATGKRFPSGEGETAKRREERRRDAQLDMEPHREEKGGNGRYFSFSLTPSSLLLCSSPPFVFHVKPTFTLFNKFL